MSMMGYDASTMGNHDFDNGLEGFWRFYWMLNFRLLLLIMILATPFLDGKQRNIKFSIKTELKLEFLLVGIELDGLVGKKNKENQISRPHWNW